MLLRLMLLPLILLVEHNAKSKRVKRRHKPVEGLMGESSTADATRSPTASIQGDPAEGELMRRIEPQPIPKTLVEMEAASAIRLAMPRSTAHNDFIVMDGLPDRFDTPIGRTLTEEFIRRDPQRCPSVAVRHMPVNDSARDALSRASSRPHQTSPAGRKAGQRPTDPKGRPTPKRPRKRVHA